MTQPAPHAVRKLGDILVECRVVTQDQVDLALAEQKRSGGKKLFGEALLDLGFISEDDLGWALSNQLNIPYIDLNADMVDLGAVSLLGPALMRRHRVLPLVRAGDALTVVLADPTNVEALRQVEEATGLTVQASIAGPIKIARVLEEVLGPDPKAEESSDLLFTEITRPYVGDGRHATDRSNPLGQLFSAALGDNVEEVHFEPDGIQVRVRFRRGSCLEDQPPIETSDFEAVVERLRQNIPLRNDGCPELQRWHSTVEFSAGLLDISVTLLPTPSGTGLVLELRKGRTRPYPIENLGLSDTEMETLRGLAAAPGLIIVTGRSAAARLAVLSAVAGLVDSSTRRIVACGRRLPLKWEGLTHFLPAEQTSPPGEIRGQLYRLEYVDALLLDAVTPGPDFDRAIDAAHAGKSVIAAFAGSDAVTALASLAQRSGSRAAAARGLVAVLEAMPTGPGTCTAALLRVSGPVAAALEERHLTRAALAQAAAETGFRPPAADPITLRGIDAGPASEAA